VRTQTKARLDLTGVTGLVLNNAQLADPTNEFTVKIKAITDKGVKMTPEDREQREALQWTGSLYLDATGALIFPGRNFIRAFRDVAPTFKAGADIDRGGVMVIETEVPILHDGPGELADKPTGLRCGPVDRRKMYDDPRFRFRTVVNGNPTKGPKGGKVVSMRPVLPVWGMSLTVVVFSDVLGWDKFKSIVEAAGAQGIGNARKLGYGRFNTQVTEL
jgi:hypothetical protein